MGASQCSSVFGSSLGSLWHSHIENAFISALPFTSFFPSFFSPSFPPSLLPFHSVNVFFSGCHCLENQCCLIWDAENVWVAQQFTLPPSYQLLFPWNPAQVIKRRELVVWVGNGIRLTVRRPGLSSWLYYEPTEWSGACPQTCLSQVLVYKIRMLNSITGYL